jgi:hypothetical protein
MGNRLRWDARIVAVRLASSDPTLAAKTRTRRGWGTRRKRRAEAEARIAKAGFTYGLKPVPFT